MKRGIVATLGLAFAVVVGLGLFGAAERVSANHAVDPDEITISSPAANTVVAVGSSFSVNLAVTTSTAPYKSIQWEMAYTANISWAAAGSIATYNCTNPGGINFPSETDTPPVESVLVPAVLNNLGGGSNCASLSGPFTGFNALGTFVTVQLQCVAVGNGLVGLRPKTSPGDLLNDASFGTALGDQFGADIPTTLENQIPVPAIPPFPAFSAAGFGVACATPVDYSVQKGPPSQNVTGDAGTNTITHTISIANPDSAAHATILVDTLPAGVTNVIVPPGCVIGPVGPILAGQVGCGAAFGAPPTPAGGSSSFIISYDATTAQECSTLVDTVQGGPGDASTADSNLANNGAGAQAVVDCPVITTTKVKVTPGAQFFTDDLVTYTITVANDAGSIANNVIVNDVLGPGQSFVSATAPCAGGFPCNLGNIAGGGSVVITIVIKMPAVATDPSCDTASATQNAPGAASGTSQVCVKVVSKFPIINGIAKDTGVTPTLPNGQLDQNFQFSIGNIFLCKPFGSANSNLPDPGAFSGAGESACGIFKIAEVGQAPTGTDTCNDDDDGDGKPCAGDSTLGRAFYQDAADLCRNVATDYMPGQTAVDCDSNQGGINGSGETAEGLGAFEFQVKFDDKLFQSPTFDCTLAPDGSPSVLGSTGRIVQVQVSIITENWVQFGCISKSAAPPAVTPGADISSGAAVLGTLTLRVQPDLFSRMRPAKDNGVSTNLLDENCEFADILGQPYNLGLGAYGQNEAPSGGLTNDCKDAALTIRMLEGDIDLDCDVDINDDQGIAFRYGQFFGQLNYNRFFDLEPGISPDFDIDIKDVQTVFGRNGSTCAAPLPAQPPLTTIPDP